MGIEQIGISGMQAAESALSSSAHNVANAGSEWFSRREPLLQPQQSANGGIVNLAGVSMAAMRRVALEAHADQVFESRANVANYEVETTYLKQIDALIGSDDTGLSQVLNKFLESIRQCEIQPESIILREHMLGVANLLATGFRSLHDQFVQVESQLSDRQYELVDQANRLAREIAEVNDLIRKSQILGHDDSDPKDRRNLMIDKLSELIQLNVGYESDGTVTLYTKSGHNVVRGGEVKEFKIQSNDIGILTVGLETAKGYIPVKPESGMLAGMERLRADALYPAVLDLSHMALILAEGFNSKLASGDDLQTPAAPGAPLFNEVNSAVLVEKRAQPIVQQGNEVLGVAIVDVSVTRPSDYLLEFTSPTQATVTRLDDGHSSTLNLSGAAATIDGLEVSMTGSATTGDTFRLKPWLSGAGIMEVVMRDPVKLAFAVRAAGPGSNGNVKELYRYIVGQSAEKRDFISLYGRVQSKIANKTAESDQNHQTYQTLYRFAVQQRDQYSGVNLDEEATRVMKFQRLYEANAVVIKANKAIMDELLSLF